MVDTALPDTLEPPPRLTGNQAGDVLALREWCWALYNNLILSGGIPQTSDLGALALLDTVGPDQIDATSVTAGSYGDATHIPQFTVDEDGRITDAAEVLVTAAGDVTGPGTATDGDFALFDGVTGKLIKDSGVDASDFDAAGDAAAAVAAHVADSDPHPQYLTAAEVADLSAENIGYDNALSELAASNVQAAIDETDARIDALASVTVGGPAQTTFLVSGGQVAWISDYIFRVSAAIYYIGGVRYESTEQDVTLDTADATDDRIDVIALDDTSTVINIPGDAAAQPSEPDTDPGTQLKLAIVLVSANTTEPPAAANVALYAENAGDPGEWNWTTSGAGWTLNATAAPHSGSKHIDGTATASGSYAQGQKGSGTFDPASAQLLVFSLQSKSNWANNRGLQISLRLAGVLKGQAVSINRSGSFGFDAQNTAAYQQLAIPLEQFAIPAGTLIDQVRFADFGGAINFRIDDISFQTSGGTPVAVGLTKAQADALYDPLGAAAAAVVTAEAYTDTAIAGVNQYTDEMVDDRVAALLVQGTNITLTYNDGANTLTIDAGASYTDEQAQDAVGLNVDAGLLYDDATPKFSVVRIIAIPVTDPNGTALTIGDGKAYLRVNSLLNGYNLTAVAAHVTTVSSSGIPTFQIANVTDAVDMLSTKLTIDAGEKDSKDATTPAVIDTTNDDVATGDELRIDCDVAGTGAKGLIVELTFSRP